MKIRQAKGSHCQATMTITDSRGQSVSQSTGSAPNMRHTSARMP